MMRLAALFVAMLCLVAASAPADTLAGDQAFVAGDYATAYGEWRAAADAGDASSMMAIGTLYDTGTGRAQDFAAALAWYKRAADAGNVRAMFNVGAMYDNGRGTPVDRMQAIMWFRRAADAGDGRAAYALGVIFRDGDGTPRDRGQAVRAFRQALAAGVEAARGNLVALHAAPAASPPARPIPRAIPPASDEEMRSADMASIERSALARTPLDPSAAKLLGSMVPGLQAQASKGNSGAQYNLAYAYENAIGTGRDKVKAYVLYLRAAVSADGAIRTAARRGAAEVGASLTPAEHATARSLLLDNGP